MSTSNKSLKDQFYSLYAKALNLYYITNRLPSIGYVDPESLQGTWNEIARKPNSLQLNNQQYQMSFFPKIPIDTTGNTLELSVQFQGYNPKGEIVHISHGTTYAYNDSNSRLLINIQDSSILNTSTTDASHMPLIIKGKNQQFWILEYSSSTTKNTVTTPGIAGLTGNDFGFNVGATYLMACDPTLKNFWIFSKEKSLDQTLLNTLLREARNNFNINTDDCIFHNTP
jgi:lipocalin